VAEAVVASSELSCEVAIPTPSSGTIDFTKVNVRIVSTDGEVILAKVGGASDCGADGGWYYDDPVTPTRVILCPTSCDEARASVGPGKDGRIEVLFGCETILK
jgi:hypothetical protein